MVTTVQIEIEDDDQYERLRAIKRHNGLTWKGMLLHAAEDLDTPD